MWIDFTYSCGHKGRKNVYGKKADRDYEIDKLTHRSCPECFAAERAKIAAELPTDGLPKLTGTEKQIVWAIQIRDEFIKTADWHKTQLTEAFDGEDLTDEEIEEFEESLKLFDAAKDRILQDNTKASWWINNRNESTLRLLREVAEDIRYTVSSTAPDNTDVLAAAIATPKDHKHTEGIVEITISGKMIRAKYPRNENFRLLIKSLGYEWDKEERCWTREATSYTGAAEDRAAELGNRLLAAGFAIRIIDDELRERAIHADYQPECKRWVKLVASGKYAGWLSLEWSRDGSDPDLYDKARLIPGSRWVKPLVLCPIDSADCVDDFADINGFTLDQNARKAIDAYRAARRAPVVPAPPPEPEELPDKLADILQSSSDIISDLQDIDN